jgi:nucleoside-diphosphate-sugar epimerase
VAPVALITGASGLIGQHVLRHWNVAGMRAAGVDHQRDDLLTPGVPTALVERVQPAVVVHLAWAASGTPGYRDSPDNEAWLRASLELARVCRAAGARLLATGTSLDTSPVAGDAYSQAKLELWQQLQPEIASGAVTWLRPYYVIDPERRRPALVDNAIAAREAGTPVVLRTPDGDHDFIHASDVGRAVVVAVEHRLDGVVPIGSGRLRRVCDLVTALGVPWVAASDQVATARPQLHDIADSRRLRELGWAPTDTEKLFAVE